MSDAPSPNEILEKINALIALMDERDKRYQGIFAAMKDRTELALAASEKAIIKAETATEKRFESVNEFRGSMKDQAALLMSRAEAEAKFKAIEEKGRWTMDKALMLAIALIGWLLVFLRTKP